MLMWVVLFVYFGGVGRIFVRRCRRKVFREDDREYLLWLLYYVLKNL